MLAAEHWKALAPQETAVGVGTAVAVGGAAVGVGVALHPQVEATGENPNSQQHPSQASGFPVDPARHWKDRFPQTFRVGVGVAVGGPAVGVAVAVAVGAGSHSQVDPIGMYPNWQQHPSQAAGNSAVPASHWKEKTPHVNGVGCGVPVGVGAAGSHPQLPSSKGVNP